MNIVLGATSEEDCLICLVAVVIRAASGVSGEHTETGREGASLTWNNAAPRRMIITGVILVVEILVHGSCEKSHRAEVFPGHSPRQ